MNVSPSNRLALLRITSERLEDGCEFEGLTPEQLLARVFAPSNRVSVPAAQAPASSEFMTVKEVAKMVILHEKVIRRAIDDGELPATKLRTRVRIRRADVEAWIEANAVEPYPIPELEP